jgi:hypothetical protein
MGMHQIKKLLYIKTHNCQNQEKTHKMGENVCMLFMGQWINKVWHVPYIKTSE